MNTYIVLYLMLVMAGSCVVFERLGSRGWAWAAMVGVLVLGMVPVYIYLLWGKQ